MLELIGKKIGMSHIYKENGLMVPVTLLKMYDATIFSFSENIDKEFNSVTIAFDKTDNVKKLSKSVAGTFLKKELPLHKKIRTSKVKKTLNYSTGEIIDVSSVISEGDKLSISGVSTGKGFAGAMKRWNFRGLEATHGVSVSHRSHGSTGQRQDPGKTFKGKKMAGHMGVDNITVKNLEVVTFDKENSVVAVKGSVPGVKNSDVVLKILKTL